MIPRLQLDISVPALLGAALACSDPRPPTAATCATLEEAFAPNSLAHISVRSTLDTYLAARQWPEGSEVLLSAVSVPHIGDILRAWGLAVVPLDLDLDTMDPRIEDLEARASPRTRAVLVAHLFGGFLDLDWLAACCAARGWDLLEDCAQAFDGSDHRGHPGATLSLFSFGTIKSATALGGALTVVRDPALLARMRAVRDALPVASRAAYARKALKTLALKGLSTPLLFGGFVRLCLRLGLDFDALLNGAVRGFSGGDLLTRLRQRPPRALLWLLRRRLRAARPARYQARGAGVQALFAALPPEVQPLGHRALRHTSWFIPVRAPARAPLVRFLRAHGFDATATASSIQALAPSPPHPPAARACEAMKQVLYLPSYPPLGPEGYRRLAALLERFYAARRPPGDCDAPAAPR